MKGASCHPPGKSNFRATREQPTTFWGILPEGQGQNLALTVLCVPYLLDSGHPRDVHIRARKSTALNPQPRRAIRGGIQKSILRDFLGNVGASRQWFTKTSTNVHRIPPRRAFCGPPRSRMASGGGRVLDHLPPGLRAIKEKSKWEVVEGGGHMGTLRPSTSWRGGSPFWRSSASNEKEHLSRA